MRCGGDADGGPSAVLGQYSELRPLAARNRIPATPVALLRFGDSTAFDPRRGRNASQDMNDTTLGHWLLGVCYGLSRN